MLSFYSFKSFLNVVRLEKNFFQGGYLSDVETEKN